jgi:hypothetical protein
MLARKDASVKKRSFWFLLGHQSSFGGGRERACGEEKLKMLEWWLN